MLRRVYFCCLFFFIFCSGFTQSASVSTSLQRPKLVVGIVIDQMRWDYLYRYFDRYGSGGFKRMIQEGFSCDNAFINYLPSFTAVGHSSIFTGSVPAFHGITGNDWIDQLTGKQMYCTGDSTVKTVGTSGDAGKMSPRNLLASTVTDELRMASNYQSKVIGISLKDRAAILPAGHTANAAYWFDDASASFITSSYYMQELPAWVSKYNSEKKIDGLLAKGWNTLYPVTTYQQSDSDDAAYEGKFRGETKPVFPHAVNEIYKTDRISFRVTPFGNTLTLDFAMRAITENNLGKGTATDFLTINCASTDYVGHLFGPNSIEIEDTYLRLDKDLADFFSFLDNKIGKNNYTVFLSADHGAAHAIGYMQKNRVPGDFLGGPAMLASLNKFLEEKFGSDKIARSGTNYQVNFDYAKIESLHLDFEAIKNATVSFLQKQPGVAFAVDMTKPFNVPEPLRTMILNGYNSKRCGSIQLIPEAGWFDGFSKTGTTHGTWNAYDTHLPLLFMGWGIRHGVLNDRVQVTDIAPTISALLHIQMPNATIGKPITAVIGE